MDTPTMARTKKTAPGKAKPEPKTVAFRVSAEYAVWLDGLARKNRTTMAGLLDQALADRAEKIGYTEPVPER
jgi:hypothetical protein